MSSQWNDPRPMSPHLQVWRWHGAMAASILHRACNIIMALALTGLALLVFSLAFGDGVFNALGGLIYSPLGAVLFGIVIFSAIYQSLAQLRHLIWDRGAMFDAGFNNTLSWVMMLAAAIVATILTLLTAGVI